MSGAGLTSLYRLTDLTRFNCVPLLTMEDDHSRKGWALWLENELDDTVVAGMKKLHGWKYANLLTDNGSQFYANSGEIKSHGVYRFQQYLADRKVRHILGRVHHPQTNGKIERFYETFQSKIHHFDTIEQFMNWYNTKRPHMSLNWDELETPTQAFYRKIDKRRRGQPFLVGNLR